MKFHFILSSSFSKLSSGLIEFRNDWIGVMAEVEKGFISLNFILRSFFRNALFHIQSGEVVKARNFRIRLSHLFLCIAAIVVNIWLQWLYILLFYYILYLIYRRLLSTRNRYCNHGSALEWVRHHLHILTTARIVRELGIVILLLGFKDCHRSTFLLNRRNILEAVVCIIILFARAHLCLVNKLLVWRYTWWI